MYEVRVRVVAPAGSDAYTVEQLSDTPPAGRVLIDDRMMVTTIPRAMIPPDLRLPNCEFVLVLSDRFTAEYVKR